MLAEEKAKSGSLEYVDRLSTGLDRLASGSVDVVLLDLGLPDSQGLATFTSVQAVAHNIPILILTGFTDDAIALEAVRRGAQDYLIKGKTDSALLIRAIDYAIARKKAEELLKKSEQRVRQLFDSTAEMFQIIELQYDGRGKAIDYYFREVNPAFERFVGKTREQLIDNRAKDWLDIKDHWIEAYERVARTGKPARYESHDAELGVYIEVYAWKVAENQVAIISNDITEHMKAEQQLREAEKFAAIGRTAAMVGHDLRNPLQAIVGHIGLAEERLERLNCPPHERRELKESLKELGELVYYMDKIVSDLQDYARPVMPMPSRTNLSELIKETLSTCHIPPNVLTSIKVPKKLPDVNVDPTIIRRVLTNLITNALQAMPEGGNLELRAYRMKDPQTVTLRVEDTGVGIPKTDHKKMFTPLFTTKSKGQGLGLPVCKKLVEAHGGTISFKSQLRKGTRFTIKLSELKEEPTSRIRNDTCRD